MASPHQQHGNRSHNALFRTVLDRLQAMVPNLCTNRRTKPTLAALAAQFLRTCAQLRPRPALQPRAITPESLRAFCVVPAVRDYRLRQPLWRVSGNRAQVLNHPLTCLEYCCRRGLEEIDEIDDVALRRIGVVMFGLIPMRLKSAPRGCMRVYSKWQIF